MNIPVLSGPRILQDNRKRLPVGALRKVFLNVPWFLRRVNTETTATLHEPVLHCQKNDSRMFNSKMLRKTFLLKKHFSGVYILRAGKAIYIVNTRDGEAYFDFCLH